MHLVPVLAFLANNVLLSSLGLHADGELFTNAKGEGTRGERGGKKERGGERGCVEVTFLIFWPIPLGCQVCECAAYTA